MNIALIGYGKMGKEVEKAALAKSHNISCIIDHEEDWVSQAEGLKTSDVAIEFTTPKVVLSNIYKLLDLNIPAVVGTTAWLSHLEDVKNYCAKRNGKLIYASNFSIGVNLFFKLNRYFADLMAQFPEYELSLEEIHHTEKLDAPSGTALSLAQDLNFPATKIVSKRIAQTPGIHTVFCQSHADCLSITHSAQNRSGFARGAVYAAELISGISGVVDFKELIFKTL